jgi:hypothetical protein
MRPPRSAPLCYAETRSKCREGCAGRPLTPNENKGTKRPVNRTRESHQIVALILFFLVVATLEAGAREQPPRFGEQWIGLGALAALDPVLFDDELSRFGAKVVDRLSVYRVQGLGHVVEGEESGIQALFAVDRDIAPPLGHPKREREGLHLIPIRIGDPARP